MQMSVADIMSVSSTQAYQQSRLHWVAACTCDAPSTKEDGRGDSSANKDSIDVTDFWEGSDAPKEVDGGRDDRGGRNQKTNLCLC